MLGSRLPRQRRPPSPRLLHRGGLEALARPWQRQAHAGSGRGDEQPFCRLGPAVQGQIEGAPMHRHQDLGANRQVGLEGLLWPQVHVGPGLVVRADLDQAEVKGTEPRTDLGEPGKEPGVAGVVHTRSVRLRPEK